MDKIIGFLICMLLIATIIPSFSFAKEITKESTFIESTYIIEKIDNMLKSFKTQNDDEIDQQQTINSGSERIRGLSAGLAQSFTPTATPLTKVSILLTKNSGNTEYANYYIEIREDIHNPTYLRQIIIPGSTFITYTNFWLIYNFTDISVTPGSSYWIVCYADIPTPDTNQVKWCYGSPGDPYPNGNSMYNTMLGWSPYDLWGDFCFKTYKQGSSPNNPPYAPSTPFGTTSGTVGSTYHYSTSAIDSDGDQISYGWDWDGDSITDEYSGYYPSGDTCTMTHVWNYPGTYNVKVKAKDEHSSLSGFSAPLTVTITDENTPPNKPDTPSGATSGKTGISYAYSTSSVDPESNDVYYLFDCGDGTNSGWYGPHNSGDIINLSHIWNADGTYPIKVKAKDTNDEESVWSDHLEIIMPKIKSSDLAVKIIRPKPGHLYLFDTIEIPIQSQSTIILGDITCVAEQVPVYPYTVKWEFIDWKYGDHKFLSENVSTPYWRYTYTNFNFGELQITASFENTAGDVLTSYSATVKKYL